MQTSAVIELSKHEIERLLRLERASAHRGSSRDLELKLLAAENQLYAKV